MDMCVSWEKYLSLLRSVSESRDQQCDTLDADHRLPSSVFLSLSFAFLSTFHSNKYSLFVKATSYVSSSMMIEMDNDRVASPSQRSSSSKTRTPMLFENFYRRDEQAFLCSPDDDGDDSSSEQMDKPSSKSVEIDVVQRCELDLFVPSSVEHR